MESEEFYDKLDDEIIDLICKHLGDKYDIYSTGTTDPRYYEKHRKLGEYEIPGLELKIKLVDET